MNVRQTARRRDDRGVSAVELVLYMPLLMLLTFLCVQFALVYLGDQAANAVARETARVARVTRSEAAARQRGTVYAEQIGQGVLLDHDIDIRIDAETVAVTVTGRAQEISPVGVPVVSETIVGPIEQFQEHG